MLYDMTIFLALPSLDVDAERKRLDEIIRIERKIRLHSDYKGPHEEAHQYIISYTKVNKQGFMQINSEFGDLESLITIKTDKTKG